MTEEEAATATTIGEVRTEDEADPGSDDIIGPGAPPRAAQAGSPSESIAEILAMVVHHTGMRTGFLARMDETSRQFTVVESLNLPGGCDLPRGLTYAATPSFCQFALDAPLFIEDTLAETRPAIKAASAAFPGVRSYFGVPVRGEDGQITGVLCGIDPEPARVTPGLPEYLALVSRLLATHLEWERDRALRDQALASVQTNDERFRSLIEQSDDIITLVDHQLIRRYSNSGRGRQLGQHDSAQLGRSLLETVHPEDAELVRANLERVRDLPGESVTYQCCVRHEDGRWLWFESTARNELLNPAVGAIVINARNVHERVTADRHAALVQRALAGIDDAATFSEALGAALRALGQENGFDAAIGWWIDPVGGNLEASATWSEPRCAGLLIETVSRQRFSPGQGDAARDPVAPEWIHDLGAAHPFPGRDEAVNLGIRSTITIPMRSSGDLHGVLQFHSLEIRDENDEAAQRIIAAAAAIEDRIVARDARERVRRSEERYRALTENSADLILVLGEDERTVWANEASGASALAFHPGALIGRDAAQFVHPDDLDSLRSTMRLAAADPGRTLRVELRIRPLDGPWFWFETAMRSHLGDPAIDGIVLTSREITDAKVDQRVRTALAMVSTGAADSGMAGAMQAVAEAGCFATGWPYGEIWSVDPDGQHLRLATAWHRDIPGADVFTDAGRTIVCPRGEGLVGRVLESGAPVWHDISGDDPTFIRQRLANALGFGSVVSVPFEEGGEVRFVASFMRAGTRTRDSLMVDLLWRFAGECEPILAHARAAESLARAEERFRVIFDGLAMPILVRNAKGELIHASKSIEGLYGWTPEELSARSFDFPPRHPDDLALLRTAFQQILDHPDEELVVAARTRCKDGTWRWFETAGRNLLDVPSVQGLVAITMDVTDRKQQEFADRIIDSATTIERAGSSLTGSIAAAMGEATRLYGFDYAEAWLAGDDGRLHCVAHRAGTGFDAAAMQESAAGAELGPGEELAALSRASGEVIAVEALADDPRFHRQAASAESGLRAAMAIPLRIGEGVHGALLYFNSAEIPSASLTADVLDRAFGGLAATFAARQAQDGLASSERRFRALTEGVSDVIIIMRGDGEVRYASPSVEALLALPADALVGRGLGAWIHPDDIPDFHATVAALREDPAAERHDLVRLRRAGGAWRWVEINFRNHEHDPAVAGIVLSIRDVTNRQIAERTTRLVNRLAALSQDDHYDPVPVCRAICEETGFVYGEMWELAPGGATLAQSGAWHQPRAELQRFAEISRAIAFRPGEGLPGAVWQTGLPAASSDATRDPRILRAEAAVEAGLHAAIAAPLTRNGAFTGVVMLLDRAETVADGEDFRLQVVTEAMRQSEPFQIARDARISLRRNEERFRALTEGLSDVIVVRTREAITYVSPGIRDLIGVDPADLIGASLVPLMHPDDAAAALASLQSLIEQHQPATTLRYRLRHAEGHWVWVEADTRNRFTNPAVGGLVVALRDITDQVIRERSSALVLAISELAREDLDDRSYRTRVLGTFCQSLDWDYGEYWRLDHERQELVYDHVWYVPTPERDRFHAGSLDLTFAPGSGLPGRAWQEGRRVWSSDVASQRIMKRAAEAAEAGLGAGLAVPLFVGGEFDGCFAFFDHRTGDEDLWRIQVIEQTLARIEPIFAARDSRIAVARSEERFRALTEHSSDVVVILDRDFRRSYVSPSSKDVLGYAPEELRGKRMGLTTSESVIRRRNAAFAELAGLPGGEVRWEQPFESRDGRLLALEMIATNHLDHPAIDGFVVTMRDITARREAERLTASLAAIVTSTPTAVLSVNRAGVIETWNPGAEHLFGLPAETAIGKNALASMSGDDLDSQAIMAAVLSGETVDPGRVRLPTFDGRTFDALMSVSPIVDTDGSIIGASVLVRDITELTEAQRELEEAQARLQVVLDSTAEGFSLVSPDRKILLMNRRLAAWMERPAEEIVGSMACILDDLFVQSIDQRRSMLGRAEDPDGVHVATLQTRETPPRSLAVYSTPVHTAEGVHLGRLSVYRDVTAESDAARAREDMVAHMTHELRTPLTAIHAYSDMILEEGDTLDPAEQREFVEVIQSSAGRVMRLVDNILEMARLESREVDLSPEVLNAADAIREMTTALAPIFRDRGQILALDLPEALPLVWASPDRVEQILANLLSNASKYTLAGGTITVSAQRSGRAVQISVSDTGVGMTPEELERLFTKFFRARNKATRAEKGTGLGLVITRNLVELQGGQMSVSSSPGTGSTFSFTLPLAPNRVATSRSRAPILVIEDTPEFARLTERRLTQEGYEVRIAPTGEAGLVLVEQLLPRLILLDLSLPGISGLTVLERLQSQPDLRDIPVIVISATPDPVATRQLGAADCLPKNIDEATFLDRVRTVLGEPAGTGGYQ